MTHTLIPRSGACSAKVVSSLDFEKYWTSDIICNYIKSGFVVSAQCPAALTADISTGIARFKGLYLENTLADTVTSLTACTDNFIYLQLDRDCCCRPKSWSYTKNITGINVTCALMIAKATTNATTITSVCQSMVNTNTQNLVEAVSTVGSNILTVHSTCASDYTVPCLAVGSSEGCCVACVCWFDNGTDHVDQCAYDTAWPSTDTGRIRGNPTTDLIDFIPNADNTDNSIFHDIAPHICGCTISDTSWVLRFSVAVPAKMCNPDVVIYLSDCSTATPAASQEFIGMRITGVDFATTRTIDGECTDPYSAGDNCVTDIVWSTSLRYVEIIRLTTTTYQVKVFSDLCYSSQTGSTVTGAVASTVAGLRYVKIGERITSNPSTATIEFDCFLFWDGVTSATCYTLPQIEENAIDENPCTEWGSCDESNPNIYVDMGACLNENIVGIMINPHCCTTAQRLKIRVSSDATFTDSENTRTLDYNDLTENSNNFFRFNPVDNARFVQIYSDSPGCSTLAINEIKILTKTDAERDAEAGHYVINGDDTSLTTTGLPT